MDMASGLEIKMIFIKESGNLINQMDREYMCGLIMTDMRAHSKIRSNTVKEKNFSLIKICMKETTLMENQKERELISEKMEAFFKEPSKMVLDMVMAYGEN